MSGPSGGPISEESKSEALDFILENALRSGFGTLGKAELDAILFAAIMKFGNQKDVTDLELSKYLQITQRKVQSLKERTSVKYLVIDLNEAVNRFVEKLDFAKKDGSYIDIPVNDFAVRNEIEGLLDRHNILLHSQINKKIFRVRIDDLLDLLVIIQASQNAQDSPEDLKKKIIASVKDSNGKLSSFEEPLQYGSDEEIYPNLKDRLFRSTVEIGLEIMRVLVPGGGLAANIIEKLMKNFNVMQNV